MKYSVWGIITGRTRESVLRDKIADNQTAQDRDMIRRQATLLEERRGETRDDAHKSAAGKLEISGPIKAGSLKDSPSGLHAEPEADNLCPRTTAGENPASSTPSEESRRVRQVSQEASSDATRLFPTGINRHGASPIVEGESLSPSPLSNEAYLERLAAEREDYVEPHDRFDDFRRSGDA